MKCNAHSVEEQKNTTKLEMDIIFLFTPQGMLGSYNKCTT